MLVDQLFNPKPLKEGGPYDLPGIDYPRPGDAPRKRPSGEHNPYPYSQADDEAYFREIFRKKREAAKKAEQDKEQGVAEGWKEDAAAHDEFLAHARQQLQAADPAERMALAVRLSNLEKKHFGDEVGQGWSDNGISRPTTGLSAGIQSILQSVVNTKPSNVQNVGFGTVSNHDVLSAVRNNPDYEGNNVPVSTYSPGEERRREQQRLQQNAAALAPDEMDAFYDSLPQRIKDLKKAARNSESAAKFEQLFNGRTGLDWHIQDILGYYEYMVKNGPMDPAGYEDARMTATGLEESHPTSAVDTKGRTQQEWMQAVKAKFPDAKIMRAKMIDGPCQATLSDGRKLSWNKVEQGVAEGSMYGDEEVSWEKGGRRAPTGAFRNPAAEKIDQANKILDNPNSSPDMKKAAASILGQEQMLLRQYKDTAARRKQGMAETEQQKGADYRDPPEADYGDEYQAMVKRVGQKAKQQEKAKQQPKAPVRESRRELLKQIIQS